MEKLEDKERFKKLIKILPEEEMDNFINHYLWNAYFPIGFNKIIDGYSEHQRRVLSRFADKKIDKLYIDLNKSFNALKSFILENFFIKEGDTSHERILHLRPDSRHSPEWGTFKKKLDAYAEDFWKKYVAFLEVSKEKFDRDNERSRWKETPRFKIVLMILASIMTMLIPALITYLFGRNDIISLSRDNRLLENEIEYLNQQIDGYKLEQYSKVENRKLLEDCLEESKVMASNAYDGLCPGMFSEESVTCRSDLTPSILTQAFDAIDNSEKERSSVCFKKYPQ